MTGHVCGRVAVLSVVVLLGAAVAQATMVFDSPWDSSPADAGAFSQLYQVLAGEFSLVSAAGVDRATWHGTMYAPDPLNTGDTWNFDIVFRNAAGDQPGGVVATTSVVASVTDTGIDITDDMGTHRAYLFDASFADVDLTAGTSYFFSVINTGTQTTFRWNPGTDSAYSAYVTSDAVDWFALGSNRTPLSFALYDDAARSGIPAPGALLLAGLGAGLTAWLRRRSTL